MNSLSNRSILLVEDDMHARAVVKLILEAEGMHVHAAGGASAALAWLGMHADVDLVVSDINMPGGMDGIQMARLIRRDDPTKRILLASGEPQASFADFPRGIAFLPKPFDRMGLLRAMDDSMGA